MSGRTVGKLQYHLWAEHGLSEGDIDFGNTAAQHARLHEGPAAGWPDNTVPHSHPSDNGAQEVQ